MGRLDLRRSYHPVQKSPDSLGLAWVPPECYQRVLHCVSNQLRFTSLNRGFLTLLFSYRWTKSHWYPSVRMPRTVIFDFCALRRASWTLPNLHLDIYRSMRWKICQGSWERWRRVVLWDSSREENDPLMTWSSHSWLNWLIIFVVYDGYASSIAQRTPSGGHP